MTEESTLEKFLNVLQMYKDEGYASPEECDEVRRDVLGANEHLQKHGTLAGYTSEEEKIANYNETINRISDALSDYGNFGDFEWCKGFGCEHLQHCKEISETIKETMKRLEERE